jgi:hypothetical protein
MPSILRTMHPGYQEHQKMRLDHRAELSRREKGSASSCE